MIVGVGIDIVAVHRIEEAARDARFLERCLTDAERAYCRTPERIAARWAAKEAFKKASPIEVSWQKIEVLPDKESGRPVLRVHDPAWNAAYVGHVSISHDGGFATAVCVVERRAEGKC